MALEYQEIATIYEKYGTMVLRRCTQLLKDPAMAEDATQEVFVRFFQKRERLSALYPSSLLYRIATNICLNVIRDNRRQSPYLDEWLYQVASWEDPSGRLEARSVLKKLFGQHEESTRTMAVLHFLDGMTLEEVAHEVGLSVSGVRKRLRRLRESLTDLNELWEENREGV
ncbi:MAG: RNA polymerase sigma factor [Chitinispirillaceae bacterium]